MRCIVYFGDPDVVPPRPARLVIPMELTLSPTTTPSIPGTIRFMVSNVMNPEIVGLDSGVELNLFRPCVNTFNKNCSMFSARGWYRTTAVNEVEQTTAARSFNPSNPIVLEGGVTHTFRFETYDELQVGDLVYIYYPINF